MSHAVNPRVATLKAVLIKHAAPGAVPGLFARGGAYLAKMLDAIDPRLGASAAGRAPVVPAKPLSQRPAAGRPSVEWEAYDAARDAYLRQAKDRSTRLANLMAGATGLGLGAAYGISQDDTV